MTIKSISFNNATQEEGESNDVVGRFRSGYQTKSGLPVGLGQFRITTGDPDVAAMVADIMGADDTGVSEWETSTEEVLQVFTTTDAIDIILEPGAVRTSMVLWSNKGKKIVETDGEYLYEDGKLTDKPWSGSTKSLKEIKQDASNGVGPSASLQAYFRLADAPALGKFRYFSGSWTAVENFNAAEDALGQASGPCHAVLSLEQVEFTAKDGTEVTYTKPQLKVMEEVGVPA